jgi:protease-4
MDADQVLERRRLRRRASFWRAGAFLILFLAIAVFFASRDEFGLEGVGGPISGQEVAEIRVDGFIATRPDAALLIEQAAEDTSVEAIVLRIDSGGGAASGGEALYRTIRKAAMVKPVVAVIDGLGASAAYMTAIAADHVVARESSVTGSIGVIFQYGHFEDLLQKIGAEYEEVKSAPLKGEPSIFEEPTPEAEAMLQAVVDDTYDWFVGLVAERRELPAAEARRLSDGSIYTGRQALRLKLVDELGDLETARTWLAKERGVSSDLPSREWEKDEGVMGWFTAGAMAGLMRLVGLDPSLVPAAASILPQRLSVDGLLSVWHGPDAARSKR